MSAQTIIAVGIVAWVIVIALIVALFHGWRWIDNAIDDELNAIAPAPWGTTQEREGKNAR